MQESDTEKSRKPTFPINPLILNRWSPRSMTGEDIDNEEIMSLFLKLQDGPLRHIIINHGDLSMQREILNIGTDCLIYWLKPTRLGLKTLRY